MAINFDSLPTSQNFSEKPLFENGVYPMTIKAATIKDGRLEVKFLVEDPTNNTSTDVWDNFFDSEKPLPQYKLGQFIRALQIPLTGTFELQDLPKIIMEKSCMGAIKAEQNEGYRPRNVIDAFHDDIFLPVAKQTAPPPADNSDIPFSTTGGPEY